MTSALRFDRLDGGQLYQLSSLGETGLTDYWAGYCPGPTSSLGATATTEAVWQDIGGFYLFLGSIPPNWRSFDAALAELRPNLAPPNQLRCLWIENPSAPPSLWRTTGLQASALGSGATVRWTVLRSVLFYLGAYSMAVNGDSELAYVADGDGGGFRVAGGGQFTGPEGSYSVAGSGLSLPFSGKTLGSFDGVFSAAAPANSRDVDLWSALNIGLQYASDAPPGAVPGGGSLEPGTIDPDLAFQAATRILFMPIFDRQSASLSLALQFDPLNPMTATRTAIGLFPAGTGPSSAFDSYFRTTKGYPVMLQPLAAAGVLPEARFVFGRCPVRAGQSDDIYRYHLSPDGAFSMTVRPAGGRSVDSVPGAIPDQLLLGLSGLEYVALNGVTGDRILFAGGNPAFAPADEPGSGAAPEVSKALTDLATTSHLTVLPKDSIAAAPVYYAQPKQAPIFSGQTPLAGNLLGFNAMRAATLSAAPGTVPPVFPVGVYAGLTSASSGLAAALENASLAPYRHYRIAAAYGSTPASGESDPAAGPLKRARAAEDPLGVTPQGLIAELTPDYSAFDALLIGNMPGTAYPKVDLTAVTGGFRHALQSNQLFFVAANVEVLMQGTSVRYQLQDDDKRTLLSKGVPQAIVDAVYAVSGSTRLFDTEAAFTAHIRAAATARWLGAFLQVAGRLKVEMDGWTFQLSPRSWRQDSKSPTLMIAKFCNRSLAEMAADTSSWAWPQVAVPQGGSLGQTQAVIQTLLAAAADAGASEPYKIFHDRVAANPSWNGFLFLNTPIDVSELPNDLQFLAAGVRMDQFYAHHIGFSQTPFQVANGKPTAGQTSAFGLIDYSDKEDLYSETTVPFDFKTLQLRARFDNASLADFSARAELLVNRLFSDSVTKQQTEHGNNLVLDGGYQKIAGKPVYSFVLDGENSYRTTASILSEIEVSRVQLQTRAGPNAAGEVTTDFILSGGMSFSAPDAFDLYSYGKSFDTNASAVTDSGLRFSGLVVSMAFDPGRQNAARTFLVRETEIGFDLANSTPRAQSLVKHFPLRLSALLAIRADEEKSTRPEDLGYLSISAPIHQSALTAPWYGLTFTLDLGTLGALMDSQGLSVELIAAWQPGAESSAQPPQYVGLKLPDAKALGIDWPLQGVMRLGFRSFQFSTYAGEHDDQVYLLKLHRLALSILGISFPPGNNEVILFGNPDQTSGSKLGWYAAYAADEKPKSRVAGRAGSKRLAEPTTKDSREASQALRRNTSQSIRARRRQRSSRRPAHPSTRTP